MGMSLDPVPYHGVGRCIHSRTFSKGPHAITEHGCMPVLQISETSLGILVP